MKKIFFFIAVSLITLKTQAQLWEITSHTAMDMETKQSMNEKLTIYVDSTMITFENPISHYFYLVDSLKDLNNIYTFYMLDKDDNPCTGYLIPASSVFDLKTNEYWIRYTLDDIKDLRTDTTTTNVTNTVTFNDTTFTDTSTAEKEDMTIYTTADVMPEYPGGKSEMDAFLNDNIKVPKNKEGQGFVSASFVVEKDGSLSNIVIKSDPCGCSAEAKRVLGLMPPWNPGEIKDEAVRVKVQITMAFMPDK